MLHTRFPLVTNPLICCLVGLIISWLPSMQVSAAVLQLPGTMKVINNPDNHAIFSCLIKHPLPADARQPTTLQLYLDSGGNIYPEADFLPENPEDIRRPSGEVNTEGDLQWYFDRSANQPIRDKLFDHYNINIPKSQQLTASNHIGEPYDTVAWDALRRAMAYQVAHSINTATGMGKKTLVVLIHGYNVADYEQAATGPCGRADVGSKGPYYVAIQDSMLKLRPELQNAIWLEVCWDGLQSHDLEIWGAAQASARYVGLGLREVLRQTDSQTPIRVFTHSAGGVVISQALWNNDAFDDGSEGRYEHQLEKMMHSIPTLTHTDVRVGMMVPALTPQAFAYYTQRSPETSQATAYRIVVGQNHRDFPINKFLAGCNRAGSTCMGANVAAVQDAKEALGDAYRELLQSQDFCVTKPGYWSWAPSEFRQSSFFHRYEVHDWRLYFKRRPIGEASTAQPIMTAFLHKVLD